MSQSSQLRLQADNNTFFFTSNWFQNNSLVSRTGMHEPALQLYLRDAEFIRWGFPPKIQSKGN